MRIVFMGTPEFALPSLRILRARSYELAAVVTAPDKPRGRGQRMSVSPVKAFAVEHALPLLQPQDLRVPEFASKLRSIAPDLIVVVAFRILPPEVYSIPRLGSFNLHASLLPKYRGAAPINWAVINGETETGVTTFLLQERVDTGSILLRRSLPIGPDESAGDLHDRLAELGAAAVFETVRMLEQGTAHPEVQDDEGATRAPKIFREDCRIDWARPAAAVHNFVRGLSPSPCAWTEHDSRVVKVSRTRVSPIPAPPDVPAGTVFRRTDDLLLVSTSAGAVALLELQQEGKRRLDVTEFLRGYRIAEGERLG